MASHAIFGLRVVPIRAGAFGIGVAVDWWGEKYSLGPVFGDKTVRAQYLAYALELSRDWQGPGKTDIVMTLGAGAETETFGERYEAVAIFPKRATSPAATLGIGTRIPLTANRARLLRIDTRARLVSAPLYDPTGVETGRRPTLSIEASAGFSYRGFFR